MVPVYINFVCVCFSVIAAVTVLRRQVRVALFDKRNVRFLLTLLVCAGFKCLWYIIAKCYAPIEDDNVKNNCMALCNYIVV